MDLKSIFNINNEDNNNKKLKQFKPSGVIVNFFLLLMFTVFPLIVTNQYTSIRTDKYFTFLIGTALLIVMLTIYLVIVAKDKDNKILNKEYLKNAQIIKGISSLDVFVICFFVVATLSTLFSGNIISSINGSNGRNNGLLLITAYTICYFIISRLYFFKEGILVIFALVGALVCGLGVLNFFLVDPFNLYAGYSDGNVMEFLSTIGNRNLFSSFVSILLPFVSGLYLTSKGNHIKMFYLICIGFAFSGLIVGNSNSGYLALVAFLVIAFLFSLKTFAKLKNFVMLVFSMLLSAKILRLISLMFNDKNRGIGTFGDFLIYNKIITIALIAMAVIVLILNIIEKNSKNFKNKEIHKSVFWIFLILFIICFISLFALIIYYSIYDTKTQLTGIKRFFRINDAWGTHRGFIWIRCIEVFKTFDIKNMLIGSGPDTLYNVFHPMFGNEMIQKYNEMTNSAHNEYLNYLLTLGILGAISYIGITVSSIIRGLKKVKENPIALIFVLAVIGYSAQAVVNISQPITTPLLFLFIALTENIVRTNSSKSEERRLRL